jgi:lipoprotein-anchoring transpeptidase ErfK/SrfK
MAEGSSSFSKFLILIILAGAAYFYYDKQIKVQKPVENQTKTDDDTPIPKTSEYLALLEKNDFKGVISILSAQKNLTPEEKLHLAIAYRETKEPQKAEKLLSELSIDKSATRDNRASARVQQVLMFADTDDYKKAMELFNSFIKELDPQQLPVIELELGDKLWEKFGNKTNTYWYEMFYAYGLAYNGISEENPRFKEVEERIQKLSHYLFFTGSDVNNFASHTIQSGENIINIAKKYDVNKELVELTNGLTASPIIREGNKLKIVKGIGSIKVNKKQHLLWLYLDGIFIKKYRIGLGKENKTPEGIFKVNASGKMTRPPWYNKKTGVDLEYTDGGTNGNPLGTHWIPFSDGSGVGVHGTWAPDSIGKDESNGCVRMLNAEVKEVYAFIGAGSTVEIE